jgi:NADPH-dependent 2,4-dienoyl-CoA reductase/sulfur reductase-like enzyme
MDRTKFVFVGGGMVAGYAAKQLVELGLKPGELKILSAEAVVPYERPPLSKGFLLGREQEASIRINPEEFYQRNGIELIRNCIVKSVDTGQQRLTLQNGDELSFENLILATGSRARRLNIPGCDLPNVLHLRSMSDSKQIRQAAKGAKRAVVLGGGFIGMEVASALTQLDVETTMAMPDERVWKNFFTQEMSQFFESYYANRGVRFVHGVKLVELQGPDCLRAAVFADGQSLACDLLVAGIGAQPATEFLESSALEMNNGVVVNEYLETSAPGVFAAGDIANYPDTLFAKRRRVEHWDNAVSQGQHVARVLMGERIPFKHVPYFFSDVFDLSYELWGDTTDADKVVYRGDPTTKSFSVWWIKAGVVVAAFVMNRPDEERESAPRMIETKRVVDAAKLADETTPVAGEA